MVDFRKWLLALAAVGLLLGLSSTAAYAQGGNQSFVCSTAAPVNNIVRAEGITELLGDLVLNCTGGTQTTAGNPIPLSNIQISINTNVTSRIVGPPGSTVSEALLLIDDPWPAAGAVPPAATPSGHADHQTACLADNSTNCAITSNVGAGATGSVGFGASGSYSGVTDDYGPHYNIFQGSQSGLNAISWTGVPVDAPGTGYTRTLRITNIRADAFKLGVASTLIPTQISMIVAVNGNANLSIVQPATGSTVGQVEPGIVQPPVVGLYGTLIPGAAGYTACNSVNTYLQTPPGTVTTDKGIGVTITEGFAYAWRPQNYFQVASAQASSYYAPPSGFTGADYYFQNEPGVSYGTESGFTPTGSGLTNAITSEYVGFADHGTQLMFTVSGVGAGVSLFAPSYIYLTGPYGTAGGDGVPVGVAVLAQTPTSSGAFGNYAAFDVPVAYASPVPGAIFTTPVVADQCAAVTGVAPCLTTADINTASNGAAVAVGVTGTTASVVYEIFYADPSVQESITVPVSVSYTANTATSTPAPTTTPATVTASFAPQDSVATADSTDPIPRFGPSGTPVSLFSISSCSCDLLFPFVTSAAGFDTGIAIANTSADPFGTSNQSGTITLTYYGSTSGGGAAPPAATSGAISAGQELVFDVYSGGSGIAATPNFTGYVIAQANFQFCHGFAFISDLGAQKLAEGYLAIVLNPPGLVRGVPPLTAGENNAH
jgi:hypothetical protein